MLKKEKKRRKSDAINFIIKDSNLQTPESFFINII